ncbi:hypothetical protein QVD17_20714 [Tagetes erecta]|uniref:Uncharacterized protein n=1 Tax=Tagetes erecta TaxID=13708 RepID=A0AAD8KPN6_TARER|nr:hypothetical protein QVD17_20714 [Tagetes erecta]
MNNNILILCLLVYGDNNILGNLWLTIWDRLRHPGKHEARTACEPINPIWSIITSWCNLQPVYAFSILDLLNLH